MLSVLCYVFFYIYPLLLYFFFFFNDTATTEIYTLSLHDALPISIPATQAVRSPTGSGASSGSTPPSPAWGSVRSEEHTSELQSHSDLVCRLLLEKKKKKRKKKTKQENSIHTQKTS